MSNLFRLVLATFASYLFSFESAAQIIRSYGGTDVELPGHFVQLPDSGFIINGSTRSFGPNNVNIYTIRTDKNGDTLWTRIEGLGSENGMDVGLHNGNQLFTLGSAGNFGPGAVHLEKLDTNGNLIWANGYYGVLPFSAQMMCEGTGTNMLIMGDDMIATVPYSSIDLLEVDSSGALLWAKQYGGNKYEYMGDIDPCTGGGYIMCGATSSFNTASNNAPDAFLMRLDAQGDTIWSKRYEVAPYQVKATSVVQVADGGFAYAGNINAFSAGQDDILLVRCDSIGDTLWTRVYGGSGPDYNAHLLLMPDSGFLVVAQTGSFPGGNNWDIYLIRTNSNGDTLWTRTIGGLQHDVPRDIIHTSNGGVAILAQSVSWGVTGTMPDYDVALIMTDSTINGPCFNGPTATQVGRAPFIVASFSPTIVSGGSQTVHTPNLMHGGIVNSWCNPLNVPVADVKEDSKTIYPNPASEEVTITAKKDGMIVTIYDLSGRVVMRELLVVGENRLDVSSLAEGVYCVSAGGEKSERLVIAR